MGTRHLTVVIDENEVTKIAQYGQWDGYPSGQGLNILNFIRESDNLARLKANLSKCEFVSTEFVTDLAKEYTDEDGFMTLSNGERWTSKYPEFARDTGSDIIKIVASATDTVRLIDDSAFSEDELMCEGIYIINFAAHTFVAKYHDTQVLYFLDELPTPEQFLIDMNDTVLA